MTGVVTIGTLGTQIARAWTEKVVVYNDWMGDCTSWEPVMQYLDVDRFTYVLTDVRGYGRSIHLTGEYNETEAAADTLELIDHLSWNRVHLVGFSMTGMVVERLAIDVPERSRVWLLSLRSRQPASNARRVAAESHRLHHR